MGQSDIVKIRIASEADAACLSTLGEATFRETFAGENTTSDIEAYVSKAFTVEQLNRELSDPLATFLIAQSAEKPIGYAKLLHGNADPNVTGTKPLELVRLYVTIESIGQGAGSALMKACIAHAVTQGFETLWLGVWEKNFRAIAFYQKWGFEVMGSHIFQLGSDAQTDFIMQKLLAENKNTDTV